MGHNPSKFGGNSNPVENVSWYDCIEYCNRRSEAEELRLYYSIYGHEVSRNEDANGYRLPTAAEWGWAASGGNRSHGYEYSGSNNIDSVAWYDGNADDKTHPVCMKKPNELGLYDMSGNVWEWCWDASSSSSDRVNRGGDWRTLADYCFVSDRYCFNPSCTYSDLGFRLARSAKD